MRVVIFLVIAPFLGCGMLHKERRIGSPRTYGSILDKENPQEVVFVGIKVLKEGKKVKKRKVVKVWPNEIIVAGLIPYIYQGEKVITWKYPGTIVNGRKIGLIVFPAQLNKQMVQENRGSISSIVFLDDFSHFINVQAVNEIAGKNFGLRIGFNEPLTNIETFAPLGGKLKFIVDASVIGENPSEVKKLRNLISVRVRNSGVNNKGLKSLAGLKKLRELVLFYTFVDDQGMANLKNMKELRHLHIQGMQITSVGLMHLTGLKKLRRLVLSHSRVGNTGLEYLSGLSMLRELDLSHTRVSNQGMAHLGELKHLRVLNLESTLVGDAGMSHLAELKLLRRLNLRRTTVSDKGLKYLKGMKNLRELDLLGAVWVGDVGISYLSGLSELRKLVLTGTKVTNAGLSHLSGLRKLRTLILSHTNVGDDSFKLLARFQHLEKLDLRNTNVGHETVARLRNVFANCIVLDRYGSDGLEHDSSLSTKHSLEYYLSPDPFR